jgi:type IV pilus assembly protein PilM
LTRRKGYRLPILEKVQRWIAEPPPDHIFEITELGVAQADPRNPAPPRIEPVSERALQPSPNASNVLHPQAFRAAVQQLTGASPARRRTAALVIPDYAVRMAILDFQEFPPAEADRLALLRFRMRKSVPFHIDEAQVSYSIQVQESQRIDVLAVAIARPILEEYQSLISERGYRVGLVIPSSLAALPLFARMEPKAGLTLIAKIAGSTISVLLNHQGRLRLIRSLDLSLSEANGEDDYTDAVLALLQQSAAFAEDQIGSAAERILFCGFEDEAERIVEIAEEEFRMQATRLRSRFGAPMQQNAGALGLLEQYAA